MASAAPGSPAAPELALLAAPLGGVPSAPAAAARVRMGAKSRFPLPAGGDIWVDAVSGAPFRAQAPGAG
ncbi:MAG TPA: hypothetical protein VK689_05175, partial [Armatimonadota bacterium]|nr:hypothetical protein [Armatimonadota bacterium]